MLSVIELLDIILLALLLLYMLNYAAVLLPVGFKKVTIFVYVEDV